MSVPPDMQTCQRRFRDAAFIGDDTAAAALWPLIEEAPAVAAARLAVYRRNLMGNLCGALAATYPVVERIVGEDFFKATARAYVRAHPSRSGDLNEYGGAFAEFLATFPPASPLPYLPDVARLEWAVQAVYYAADEPPADLSALACLDSGDDEDLVFRVAGDIARLDSPWPLAELWRVNQPEYDGPLMVDFSLPAQIVVWRWADRVQVEEVTPVSAALFDYLRSGMSLAAAIREVVSVIPDFDPLPEVVRWCHAGWLRGAFLKRH
ncbi:MAG: putative DNA-binding domain-containing protein [Proteobacteria bacterium]|nr:putative DNA-binding domain-containing protein [Pseudomonadota bacterium]HQR03395.1 DNA-binding domain-containing protein [Rhodocyclaceae bacterium]